MMTLPDRLRFPQDVEDVYSAHEQAANHYVATRLPFTDGNRHETPHRFFITANSIRYVSDYQIAQLSKLDDEYRECIYMQRALNLLGQVKDVLGRKLEGTLLIHLKFNKEFQAALQKTLTEYDALRAPEQKDQP